MKKLLALFSLLIITAFSYGNGQNYEIKSGNVEFDVVTEMFGIETHIKSIVYFDNFGEMESNRIISSEDLLGIGENLDLTNLKLGNKYYQLNNNSKSYSYLGENDFDEDEFNFDDYEKVDNEKILGKDCDVLYFEEIENNVAFKHKVWMWKGLVLKSESYMEAEEFTVFTNMEAKKINIGNVAQSKFEIPSDYKEEI